MDIASIHNALEVLKQNKIDTSDLIFKMTEKEFQRYAENISPSSVAKVWQDLTCCGRSEVRLLGVKVLVEG